MYLLQLAPSNREMWRKWSTAVNCGKDKCITYLFQDEQLLSCISRSSIHILECQAKCITRYLAGLTFILITELLFFTGTSYVEGLAFSLIPNILFFLLPLSISVQVGSSLSALFSLPSSYILNHTIGKKCWYAYERNTIRFFLINDPIIVNGQKMVGSTEKF